MSGKLPGLRKRLAKIEKAVAEKAERKKLVNCICIPCGERHGTTAFSHKPEEFEGQMNQTCPAHGFRDLGDIMIFRIVKRGGGCDSSRLDQLITEYRERKSQNRKAKLEHDSEEA